MSASNKRTPSKLSVEEEEPPQKSTRQEEEAPAWAANMQAMLLAKSSEISRKMDDLNVSMNHLQLTVATHEEKIISITQKVGEN